ncbi:tetratricopeptide repeat protein [Synechococcales cyanobacterium C]|uniref:Tetratricopeptide repeat protein n=2 Tax=Petrachloros TaxID=2918834 RepID=A0A8K2A1X1_9CYAN|nr:glycosyltransferase family 2 protein [Petrachloros mirabilis]NCJ07972.1 tetratricopeptide repeat protein [Petrachloros mirabilis ULC683]
MRVSLCMIVRDEAARLPRCLASTQGLVDEIVVLDTGSEDETVRVARRWGAQVYEAPWEDDFALARNIALAKATGDWVLVLDADEVLCPDAVAPLRAVMGCPQYLLVNLIRQEVGAKQSPFSQVARLFRRHPRIAFERPYHESVEASVEAIQAQEPHWQIGALPRVVIEHDGYRPAAIAPKIDRARRIMARHLAQHPDDAYLCSKLGALYVEAGDLEAGLALLRRGLDIQPPDPPVRYELHYHLGLASCRQGEIQPAITQYQLALAQDLPDLLKIGAYTNLASLLLETGQAEQAQPLYQRVLALQPDSPQAHYNLGLTQRALGDLGGAIAAYRQAIELDPDYGDAYQNLGVALLKQGQVAQSQQAFAQALHLHRLHKPIQAEQLHQQLTAMGLL